jgi:hypothetical protein
MRVLKGWSVAVGVLGLVITAALVFVTSHNYGRNERRLLSLQTQLTADAISASGPLYVEDHLGGAASLAAATNGEVSVFRKAMSGSVGGSGSFATASLWHVTGGTPRLVAAVGGTPLLAPCPPAADDPGYRGPGGRGPLPGRRGPGRYRR